MKEEDHPLGACYFCVHCRPTDRVEPDTKDTIYSCAMMEVELSKGYYATECNQRYTGADD
jgi:hypothetical protein